MFRSSLLIWWFRIQRILSALLMINGFNFVTYQKLIHFTQLIHNLWEKIIFLVYLKYHLIWTQYAPLCIVQFSVYSKTYLGSSKGQTLFVRKYQKKTQKIVYYRFIMTCGHVKRHRVVTLTPSLFKMPWTFPNPMTMFWCENLFASLCSKICFCIIFWK